MKNLKLLPINDQGSVTVVVLLVLMLLTIYGISATSTTIVEQQIASNDQLHKIAYYNAEGGINAAAKLIERSLVVSGPVVSSGRIENPPDDDADKTSMAYYLFGAGDDKESQVASQLFYHELGGFKSWDADNDIEFNFSEYTVQVDVKRTRSKAVAGGGVEFASGAEGVGAGSAGGVTINYTERAIGTGPRNTTSYLTCTYRKKILGGSQ